MPPTAKSSKKWLFTGPAAELCTTSTPKAMLEATAPSFTGPTEAKLPVLPSS